MSRRHVATKGIAAGAAMESSATDRFEVEKGLAS
jgi:hypothetical protein